MTMLLDSGLVTFTPRARLLKLIGAELISDEVVALAEIVKNAHDADASRITIEFVGVTDDDGEIIIRDDGHGMSLETLLNNWMQPAGSTKSGKNGRRTPRGRRFLGEKGVGRFAVDKLAAVLELTSRCPGENREVHAFFDWDEFDSDTRMLSEVSTRWEVREAAEIENHGTILRLKNLRGRWSERMFRRLCTRLSRLQSPFAGEGGFTIEIDSDEFPQYSGELKPAFLERAPYQVEVTFDGRRTVEVSRNGEAPEIHRHSGGLACGPVRVRLFAYDLETEALSKIAPRAEVRAWLREWSGISIYRDGFRLWPYGEPHDDWLRLDQRRVNNPVEKLSNNQIVGFVEISSDSNPDLNDQTNREGLISNRAYRDLRLLMYFVLEILETYRQGQRHPERGQQRGKKGPMQADSLVDSLDRFATKLPEDQADELRRLGARIREQQEREAAQSRQVLASFTDLAALGYAANALSQGAGPLIGQLRKESQRLERRIAAADEAGRKFRQPELGTLLDQLEAQLDLLTPVESGANQRRRTIDVIKELEACKATFLPGLLGEVGLLEIRTLEGGVIRTEMRPENLHRLVHILATNSAEWLRETPEPRVSVTVKADDDWCEILFSDNGPGIPTEIANRVFEPFFTWKEAGQGMGLTIARSIVQMNGGEIRVLQDGRRRGANIEIRLPRKRSRATIH